MSARKPNPEEVFHEARRITSSAERNGFLRGVCGGNLALRSKVDALLKADDEAGAFLASGGQPSNAADASLPHERVGTMIGRYKLLQEIGEGGFGVVYLAEQKKPLRRKVALKVIKPGMDTKQVIARFEAERQALAMMDHAHIAKVLDAGATDSGRPYFVMELVKGIAITDYCDQNNLTVQERLDLFSLVCSAVQHAHQKGIIHRDIKPSNVLVTLHDGVPVPKVIDFGIAKATSAELTEKTLFTEHGQMIGTPVYMSPEQAEMSGLDIDTRSDIYSLGVLLYELLTGTTPFTMEDLREAGYAGMQRLIREHEPPKPSTRLSTLDTLTSVAAHRKIEPRKLGPLIRGDLDWIIMKALEKDRTRRYETANAFAADIQRHLSDEPVVASPPSAAYRVWKFVRRNRKGVVAGAITTIILLATTGLSIYFGVNEGRQRRVAVRNAAMEKQTAAELAEMNTHLTSANKEVVRKNDQLEEQTERAERLSYSAFLLAAEAQLDVGNFADAQRLHGLCPEPYRNWEWHHLGLSLNQSLLTRKGHESGVNSVSWSPDGTRIVTGSSDSTLRIWAASTGESLMTLVGHQGSVHCAAWSPDGTRIVSGSKSLRIWDATTGEGLSTLQGKYQAAISVAWSPDGTRIVSGFWDGGTLRIWDAATGKSLLLLKGHRHPVNSVAWSPDGTRIVSGSMDSSLRIWDTANGNLLRAVEGHESPVLSVAWSPDGKSIVSGHKDQNLHIWDAKSGERLRILRGHESAVSSVAWSLDGKRIVSGSWDKTLRIWDAASGEELSTLQGHGEAVRSVAWSPDGVRIVSGSDDATLRFWDVNNGDSVSNLSWHGEMLSSVAWSMDGTRIVAAAEDGTMRIWDAATGGPLLTLKGEDGVVSSTAWSPDGGRIVTGEWDGTMGIRATTNGQDPMKLKGHEGVVSTVAWSPDGTRIVSGSWDETLRIWDAASGQSLMTLEGHEHYVFSAAWSPDGTRIVSGSDDSTLRIWDATNGQSLMTLGEQPGQVSAVVWSPGGTRVASASSDSIVRVWDASSGEGLLTLEGHESWVRSLAWSPDGTRIVSGSDDKTLHIWDADSGASLQILKGHDDGVILVAWSPDGMRVVSGAWAPSTSRIVSGTWGDKTLLVWESRLEDALPVWRAEGSRSKVRSSVHSLFKEHIFLKPVLSALRDDHSLPENLREVALRMARSRGNPTFVAILEGAWSLVDPGRENEDIDAAFALRLARAALTILPKEAWLPSDKADAHKTLAWALFANDLHDEALAQAEQALKLAPDKYKVEYQGYLDRLRERVAEVRTTDALGKQANTQDR